MIPDFAGVRKGRPPSVGRAQQCLWCDATYSTTTDSGFLRHLRTVHGFAGIKEALGGLCPVCGKGPYKQILQHCATDHLDLGFECVTQAFIWARDNGDPYGQYAERVQRKGTLDPQAAWQDLREREKASPANQPKGKKKTSPK